MTLPLLCIYHGHCDDGFGAAYAVRHARPNTEFFAAVHGAQPPDVKDREVVIVDFCYPLATMNRLVEDCRSMLVLDHHKSSMLDMQGFNGGQAGHPKCLLYFDMEKSGAMLAWLWFNKKQLAPRFIEYIQDRDLWTKKLRGIDEFTAGLRSWPMTFEAWDTLFLPGFENQKKLVPWPDGITPLGTKATDTDYETRIKMILGYHQDCVDALIKEGMPIVRYVRQLVDDAVRNSFWVEIDVPILPPEAGGLHHDTKRVRGANVIPAIVSEVGEELAKRYGGVGLTWVQGPKLWNYQLRSRPTNPDLPVTDVSKIAAAMGGGGHAQASGFKSTHPVHRKWVPEDQEDL